MANDYSFIPDLATSVEVPKDGILSRTAYTRDGVKAVLFGFSPGQELSEHTAGTAAIIQIVRGEARLTVGEDTLEVGPGAVVQMTPRLRHSVLAKTELVMLLLLLKGEG